MTKGRRKPTRAEREALERLERARTAWDMRLAGHGRIAIAERLQVPLAEVERLQEFGERFASFLRDAEFDLTLLRRLTMERYEHLLRANWDSAMGTGIREALREVQPDMLPEERDLLETMLGRLLDRQIAAGKLVLQIMEAQSKLLGLVENEETDGKMPTIVFVAPRPDRLPQGPHPEAIEATAT